MINSSPYMHQEKGQREEEKGLRGREEGSCQQEHEPSSSIISQIPGLIFLVQVII